MQSGCHDPVSVIDCLHRWMWRLVLFLAAAGVASCQSDNPENVRRFTQCIKASNERLFEAKSLAIDNERKCRGVRWQVPRALTVRKYVSYEPLSETVIIRLEEKERTQIKARGLERLLPPVSSSRIEVRPVFDAPASNAARARRSYEASLGLEPAPDMFGLQARRGTRPNHHHDVLLYPSEDATYFAVCQPLRRPDGTQELERAICIVSSSFDRHVELRYSIRYAHLGRLAEIDQQMIAWIRSFMVATH